MTTKAPKKPIRFHVIMHGDILSRHTTYHRAKVWLKFAKVHDPKAHIAHAVVATLAKSRVIIA